MKKLILIFILFFCVSLICKAQLIVLHTFGGKVYYALELNQDLVRKKAIFIPKLKEKKNGEIVEHGLKKITWPNISWIRYHGMDSMLIVKLKMYSPHDINQDVKFKNFDKGFLENFINDFHDILVIPKPTKGMR